MRGQYDDVPAKSWRQLPFACQACFECDEYALHGAPYESAALQIPSSLCVYIDLWESCAQVRPNDAMSMSETLNTEAAHRLHRD